MSDKKKPDNNENNLNDKNDDRLGKMNIAEEVYAITAGNATLDVEGVAAMSGGLAGGIAKILGRKNITKGVKIEETEEGLTVDLNLIVKYKVKIPDVTRQVQLKVKEALETVTGADVQAVNVNVLGIEMPEMTEPALEEPELEQENEETGEQEKLEEETEKSEDKDKDSQ